jgi:hypothetical protein
MRIPYDRATGRIGGQFAWAQDPFVQAIEDQYNAGLPVRIIVLKARQLGFSTITEGVIFNWLFMHPGTHGLTLAHDSDVSEELFAKTKTYWEKWPLAPHYHLKYATKQNMHWVETGSQLKIATAGNSLSGRGHTLHAVHLSEVAFYPNPKKLMLGLMNSVPEEHGTIMVVESTANGIGNYFYNMWNEAVDGASDYLPLFFPWWRHPEYRKTTTLSVKSELTVEEKQLRRMMRDAGYNDGRIFEHLHWRRWMLKNKVADIEQFMQEYPSTPEEAFRMSGTPVFPEAKLRDAFHDRDNCFCHGGLRGYLVENLSEGRVKFHKDRAGPVRIFKLPSRKDRSPFRYFLGADPAETVYGDLGSIQVISRDLRKPIEQMACYSDRVDGPQLAIEIMKMGRFYNNCMVCPEAEGGGQACIQRILDSGYPLVWLHEWADKAPGKKSSSYGFSMNWSRKKWCVSEMQYALFQDNVVLHDQLTYSQFLDYAHWDNGELGNASPDGHDDAVMAFIIAVLASHTEAPYVPDSSQQANPILDIYSADNTAMEMM